MSFLMRSPAGEHLGVDHMCDFFQTVNNAGGGSIDDIRIDGVKPIAFYGREDFPFFPFFDPAFVIRPDVHRGDDDHFRRLQNDLLE